MMQNKIFYYQQYYFKFLVSCNNKSKNESLNSSVPGIILENMDLNINPRDNFMIMLMEIGLKLHKFQMMRRVGEDLVF